MSVPSEGAATMNQTRSLTTVRYGVERLTTGGLWITVTDVHSRETAQALLLTHRTYNPGKTFRLVQRILTETVSEIPVV